MYIRPKRLVLGLLFFVSTVSRGLSVDTDSSSKGKSTCPTAVLDRFESRNTYRVISDTTIIKLKKLKLLDCAERCAIEPTCAAFNFRVRTGMCVLKHASDSDAYAGVTNVEWTFYTLSAACKSSPILSESIVAEVVSQYQFMISAMKSGSSVDMLSVSRESSGSAAAEVVRYHRTAGLVGTDEDIAKHIIGQRPLCGADHTHQVPADVLDLDAPEERSALWSADDRITIKLVFHILHADAVDSNKIAESVVQDQVDVLNEAFSGSTHQEGVDTNIRFKVSNVHYIENSNYTKDCRAEQFVTDGHVSTDASVVNIFTCYDPYWIGWAYVQLLSLRPCLFLPAAAASCATAAAATVLAAAPAIVILVVVVWYVCFHLNNIPFL